MNNKIVKRKHLKSDTAISLQKKIRKLEMQVDKLQNKILKLENKTLKQEGKIIQLVTKNKELEKEKSFFTESPKISKEEAKEIDEVTNILAQRTIEKSKKKT